MCGSLTDRQTQWQTDRLSGSVSTQTLCVLSPDSLTEMLGQSSTVDQCNLALTFLQLRIMKGFYLAKIPPTAHAGVFWLPWTVDTRKFDSKLNSHQSWDFFVGTFLTALLVSCE